MVTSSRYTGAPEAVGISILFRSSVESKLPDGSRTILCRPILISPPGKRMLVAAIIFLRRAASKPYSANCLSSYSIKIRSSRTPPSLIFATSGSSRRSSLTSLAYSSSLRSGTPSPVTPRMIPKTVPTSSSFTTGPTTPWGRIGLTSATLLRIRVQTASSSLPFTSVSNSTVITDNPDRDSLAMVFTSAISRMASSIGSVTSVSIWPGSAPGNRVTTEAILTV